MEKIEQEIVRWTLEVSKDTDTSLRSFLAQRGMKKGDLSRFIERAVQHADASHTRHSRHECFSERIHDGWSIGFGTGHWLLIAYRR